MKTSITFFLSAIVLISGAIIYRTQKTTQPKAKPIIIGMLSGWAPFMTIDNQGNYEGFDIEVAQEIGKRLRQPVEIKDAGSLAALLLSLEQGTIDLAMSGLDITQERQKKLCMVPYTGQAMTSFKLIFWEKVPLTITSLQDLSSINNPIVCVEPGSSQEAFLEHYPSIIIKSLSRIEEMVLDIQYNKSLAMLVEPQVATRITQNNNNLKVVSIPLPDSFATFGIGIAIKKTNTELASRITAVINTMRRDKTLAALETTWNLEVA